MSKRWAIASDPRLLARIAIQEKGRVGEGVARLPKAPRDDEVASPPHTMKKQPSTATRRAEKVAVNNQDSRGDKLLYDATANTLTIVLPGAELLSHNTSLRMHNAKQTRLKTTWFKRIQTLMLQNLRVYDLWKIGQQCAFPLVLEEVYATGESNCLDVESVTAACKPIVDALVRTKFIPDDGPRFIAQPIAYTYRQPANGLVLVLRPAPRPWGEISDSTIDISKAMPVLPG